MNAKQTIKTKTQLLHECKKNKSFKWISFNSVIVYLYIINDVIMFNITKLYKSLNAHTKSNSAGASIFVKHNIIEKGWLEYAPDKFMDVQGKGTQEFKGMYVSLDLLSKFLLSIGGLNAFQWYIGDDAWYETLGKGWVYLIKCPQHNGKNVFKYGRTVNLNNRFILYLSNAPFELQTLGIEIIAIAPVNNQSKAEDSIAKAFDRHKCLSTDDGREYRLVISEDDYEGDERDLATEIFCEGLDDIDEWKGVQCFDENTNIFKFKRDEKMN